MESEKKLDLQLDFQEVILELMLSYFTKEDKPGIFEVIAIENGLNLVKEKMEAGTYRSYRDWIARHKMEEG